jgi:hypothetical protein
MDLFDFILTPTDKEYRKENIIDGIYGIPKLNIPNNSLFNNCSEHLINDAIVNYNNEVTVAKRFYVEMENYQKYYLQEFKAEYDYWVRKSAEQTIKELFSIFDKSFHIINYLFDLKIKPEFGFNKNVLKKLLKVDNEFYLKMNYIDEKMDSTCRNNITHNFSNLFVIYEPIYDNNNVITEWNEQKPLSYEEYNKIINDFCSILVVNKKNIVNKICEFYPDAEAKRKHQQEMFEKLVKQGSD